MNFKKKVFYIIVLVAFSFNAAGKNSIPRDYSVQIESLNGNNYHVGDIPKFKGQLLKKNSEAGDIQYIVVEDPVSQMSSRIKIDSMNTFEYTTLSAVENTGTYCFAFLIPQPNDSAFTVFYTISVEPDFSKDPNSFYIPLNDFEVSLGYQGTELDESTDLISKKILDKNYQQNKFSPSTLSFYAESFEEAASDYGKKYLETITSSPTNYIVLIGATVICFSSSGVACAPLYGILFKNLVTTSIDLDIDYLVDQSNLDLESKNKVKFWTKLGTKGVISIAGLSSTPEGSAGFLSGVNFGGKWTEFISNNSVPIFKDIIYNRKGEVTDYKMEVKLKDNSIICLSASSIENSELQLNTPKPFKYFDTEILMANGSSQMGNVISGQFEGIEYGVSTSTSSNSIKFICKDGTIKNIPAYDIKNINHKILQITELNGATVKLNFGNEYGIKQGQVYQVYQSTVDILNTPQEFIRGYIQILEVNDDSSTGIIVNKKNGDFSIGNYCR